MTDESEDIKVVTLYRAERAADLWSALEAAQFGHIIQQDEEGPLPEPAVGRFLTALSEVIEDWEAEPTVQAGLMQKLQASYSGLQEGGNSVHWGALSRTVELPEGGSLDMPIAILHIGAHDDVEITLGLPRQLMVMQADEAEDED